MKFWKNFWRYYDLGSVKNTRKRMKKNPDKYIEITNYNSPKTITIECFRSGGEVRISKFKES